MKLAVTVLASILFACSVTTATPVNPSATTSAEASTSTAQPTEITSTVFEDPVFSYEEATSLVDLSKFSKDDMELFEGYLQTDQEYQEAKKACDSAKSEELNQKELIKRLLGENYELFMEYPNRNDPVYQEKREIIGQKIDEEDEKLFSLQEKLQKLDEDLYHADLLLDSTREKLAKRLFKNSPSTTSLHSRIEFLESNPSFIEGIYQSLILRLNKQPGSEQASTSGTQNKSKHHKSPSSSSKTSTVSVQPIQTSSSTQAALSSTQRTSRSNSRLFGLWGSPKSSRVYDTPKSKNELKSFLDSPNPNDSDESDDESSV
ncbi:hypothetical protein BATDEDRAFT_25054 [Batrachochytrium dendrobatidis JAM81]|uniref:Uncharacterized protein n=1 Tax=Batrachochytrium dendrobatidis (strain JAM81 / FGSC 10211) TaxID=684364 RepID=F4P3K1_BATDJ|nr:uncharacterized protein BATDEDRAFT_25054 [Batrachochytrium dendrobatidis JAM81]EGF80211.1 hypothetical protein BATDEDRAFT_25054 [Batrachochytrium dendrobatidis JAM81]|eukprot:XP_006679000.1 hypothetical protein BATDEDRAFT_25054 [Batrachochytrium dendrobatidis JAM81]